MGKILRAILEKTGIRRFFSSVAVELPAYLLPNFNVTEIPAKIETPRSSSSSTR
jgi:hypothetical protein